MPRRRRAGVVWLLVAAAAPAACGRSASSSDSGATPAGAKAGAAGANLVPHAKLAAELPAPDGWQRQGPVGAAISLPAPASHASASYSRGPARIDLEITDTGGAPEHIQALAKVAGSTFEQKASNGYMKGTTFDGFPAIESWNHVDRLGDISVLIDRRFIVNATSTGLEGIATLQKIVQSIDLKKIAAMK